MSPTRMVQPVVRDAQTRRKSICPRRRGRVVSTCKAWKWGGGAVEGGVPNNRRARGNGAWAQATVAWAATARSSSVNQRRQRCGACGNGTVRWGPSRREWAHSTTAGGMWVGGLVGRAGRNVLAVLLWYGPGRHVGVWWWEMVAGVLGVTE